MFKRLPIFPRPNYSLNPTSTTDATDMLARLRRDGVVCSHDAEIVPLTGGVSSDIYLVKDGGNCFVAKRALAKLRVQSEWLADTSRNGYEQRYLRYVHSIKSHAVPEVLHSGDGYFVMQYLGKGYEAWKAQLIRNEFDRAAAQRAGELLGIIHHAASNDVQALQQFETDQNFYELRIEPYLLATALAIESADADAASEIRREAQRLIEHHETLVHGDYSPKNILVGHDKVVLLDAEVAWYGDPAFDLAFCLTHFLLKSLYHHPVVTDAPQYVQIFCDGYQAACGRRHASFDELSLRVGRLLRMILLARVDGKSPVEYLDEAKRAFVRQWVLATGLSCDMAVPQVAERWFNKLGKDGVSG